MGLPTFGFVAVHAAPLADGIACEASWLAQVAANGRPTAQLWRGAAGFVVPRSYERRPHWQAARAASAAEGWPVNVRASGGGIVPQGAGLWNLSLLWPVETGSPVDTDAVYRSFTDGLAAALARLGVAAVTQAVSGSFCDGRYNLAVGGRKLVGTAQAWRRVDGQRVVLAHAVIVASADPAVLTAAANRFEVQCGGTARYRAEALTSVAEAWCAAHVAAAPPSDIDARLVHLIAEQFACLTPPRMHDPCPTANHRPKET